MAITLSGLEFAEQPFSPGARSGPIIKLTNAQVGTFYVTPGAAREFVSTEMHKLLSAIYHATRSGRDLLVCTQAEKSDFTNPQLAPRTIKDIWDSHPATFAEKQTNILRVLYELHPNIGERIDPRAFQPYMFYSKDGAEMAYLFQLMDAKQLVQAKVEWPGDGEPIFRYPVTIGEHGWLLLEDALRRENSKTAFVAMWFDTAMDAAYQAIRSAIEAVGFQAVRIDEKQHNNEISGEILYEIRRSRFLVADVTGQRHGVYFEAGYALGKGIPLIWACRADELNRVHFDTRQYNHVVWANEGELEQVLSARIRGTILQ